MEENRTGYTILIADDDPNVHQSLHNYFKRERYNTISTYDGENAVKRVFSDKPDLIIMDIMMPRLDGFEALREIRKRSNTPVIMLSAKSEEFDKLIGLELGADDYVTKPFSPREVLARVKAVLRRMHEMSEQTTGTVIRVKNLEINMNAFAVSLNDKEVACTPKEIEILWTLVSNPGMVFSREHLLESIWGYDFLGDTRAVDSHIKRIRAKLCRENNGWDIKTVWGVGYRFETGDA